MKIAVAHLEGSRRGAAELPEGDLLRIGSGPSAEIRIDEALAEHARLDLRGGRAVIEALGPMRLNRRPVSSAELHDGDLLEVGNAATLRIRLLDADGFALPRRGALDAGRPHFSRAGLLIAMSVAVIAACVVAVAFVVSGLAGSTARTGTAFSEEYRRQRDGWNSEREGYETRIALLESDLRGLGKRMAPRTEMEERVGEVRRAVAEVESSVLRRVDTQVARSVGEHPDLRAARDALHRIEGEDAALQATLKRTSAAVCLIQGAYGFGRIVDGKWKFLREASPDVLRELQVGEGKVPLVLEGDGPVFKVEYTGSGFLVDASGVVLTNRHIAQPWWKNDAAQPLLDDGFSPRFILLRAYFPGRDSPVLFHREQTLYSDEADLAALRFDPSGELPEPLSLAADEAATVGRRVLLLGYPSGLNALLARSGEEFSDEMTRAEAYDPVAILDALAERGMVRPLPTQGHIGDVVANMILFDAPTAGGGSGAPVLDMEGRVLAVNYGILKSFSGANFAVPIRHAAGLLERAQAAKKPG